MSRFPQLIALASFVAAALLAVGVAFLSAVTVERRSVEAVDSALTIEGHDWVQVTADGLQVMLHGTAPDEASNFSAFRLAGTVVDADRVINMMSVRQTQTVTPPRFSLDMLRNDDGIQLIGLVPTETGTAPVTDGIADIAAGVEVTNMVETADFPAPATWEAALDFGLRALTDLPRSKVTVYEDLVEVQAISESAAERAEVLAALEQGQPQGVEVMLDISAPRPVITPFTTRFIIDADGARFDTCAADTDAARDRIVAAAAAAGAQEPITCRVGLGTPSPQWGDAVTRAIAALTELGGGTVTITDADVTLVAAAGTGQDMFDRVAGELGVALPELFSLEGVLPPPPGAGNAGPPRFIATLADTGTVELRGRVPGGPVGTSVSAYAMAVFGRDETDVATRAVPDLPEGWAMRAMVGLDALALLAEGTLTVEPDLIRLEGRSGDSEIGSDVARLLTERLGRSGDFDLDIRYDESLDPVASLASPEECIARLQAVQEDNGKIVFEPGSVEITEEAGLILDRIAEILPDCRHVRMEIGGHTDSQGSEELNLNLSQARADSVLNGLLARNVLVSNLIAQGYGESQPIADNDTEEGREQNRRIAFRLLSEAVVEQEALEAEEELAEAAARLAELAEFRPAMRPDSVVEAAAEAAEGDDE